MNTRRGGPLGERARGLGGKRVPVGPQRGPTTVGGAHWGKRVFPPTAPCPFPLPFPFPPSGEKKGEIGGLGEIRGIHLSLSLLFFPPTGGKGNRGKELMKKLGISGPPKGLLFHQLILSLSSPFPFISSFPFPCMGPFGCQWSPFPPVGGKRLPLGGKRKKRERKRKRDR